MPNNEGVKARPNEHQTRAQMVVHPDEHGVEDDAPWIQQSNLEAPPPRPGMGQRWLRVSLRGDEDGKNISGAFREGWIPRKWDTVPEEWKPMRIIGGAHDGCIGVHGMILVELPLSRIAKRNEFVRTKTERQTQAVKHDLVKNVPLVENQMDSSVSVPRRPRVSDD